MPDLDNPDVIYVAGDLEDDVVLSEDEAIAILANYGRVRQYLHKKALGRGFHKYPPPGGGRKGKGKGKPHGIRRAIPMVPQYLHHPTRSSIQPGPKGGLRPH